ncbi:epidermal growth factor-like protein 6 [Mercenaria mercenaria]|uniref:epidermal growth factor-like protein 6 n=1 Tax=Mercenaria mercenaria TaxID=6596 RepID=UPI00234F1A01|nr:epidermal growth factor-like protein 6 [Mercenaria mercenaria]
MLRRLNEEKNLIRWNSELYFMIIFFVLTYVKTDVIRDITDIDECANYYQVCPLGTRCINTEGSWDCLCQEGLKAIETSHGKMECQDPCSHARCFITSTCRHFDNEDGYICRCPTGRKGKYCQGIDHDFHEPDDTNHPTDFKTTMYIICGTLGGAAVICIFIIIGICRKRLPEIQNTPSRTTSAGQHSSNTVSNVLDIPMSNQPQGQEAGRSKGVPQRGKTNKRNAEKDKSLQSNSYRDGQREDLTDYNISHLIRDEHQYETIRDDHVYETLHTYVNM